MRCPNRNLNGSSKLPRTCEHMSRVCIFGVGIQRCISEHVGVGGILGFESVTTDCIH